MRVEVNVIRENLLKAFPNPDDVNYNQEAHSILVYFMFRYHEQMLGNCAGASVAVAADMLKAKRFAPNFFVQTAHFRQMKSNLNEHVVAVLKNKDGEDIAICDPWNMNTFCTTKQIKNNDDGCGIYQDTYWSRDGEDLSLLPSINHFQPRYQKYIYQEINRIVLAYEKSIAELQLESKISKSI